MPTVLVKVLAGTGAFVIVSGVWSAMYLSNTGTTIGDKLEAENLKLITNINDYKFHLFEHKDSDELKKALELGEINFETHTRNLKEWCDNKVRGWASSDKDESIFKNVREWCAFPTIIFLRHKIEGDLHSDGDWQGKYTHFATPNSGDNNFLNALKNAFEGFDPVANANEGGKKLKDWCETAMWLKTYEVNLHKSVDNVKAWCIKTS